MQSIYQCMYHLTAYFIQSSRFVCCVVISSICIASSPKAPVVPSSNGPQSAFSLSISKIIQVTHNADEIISGHTSQIYKVLGRVSSVTQPIPNFHVGENLLCPVRCHFLALHAC